MEPTNLKLSESLASTAKLTLSTLTPLMTQLGRALQAEVDPALVALYWNALCDLSLGETEYGFRQALKFFVPAYGRTFPAPAEIRAWAEGDPAERERAAREITRRDSKPEGWEPMASESSVRDLPFPKGRVTREEIAGWLAAGAARQEAHLAKLAEDPKWRAKQAEFGVPQYRIHAEQLAAERNGKTTMPADLMAKKKWAHQMAVKNGWLTERQPGDGDE